MAEQFPASLHIQKTVYALSASLPASLKDKAHIIYLEGQGVSYRHDTDHEQPWHQEANFFYLSGCNVSGAALIILVRPPATASTVGLFESILLIPDEDPLDVMWSPPPPTLAQARTAFPGHGSVQNTSALTQILKTLVETYPEALIHSLPFNSHSTFPRLSVYFSRFSGGKQSPDYLLPALHAARLTKTPYEIDCIRKANAISSRAHEVIMRLLGKHAKDDILGREGVEGKLIMPSEWRIEREAEAEAAFVASCRREGAVHQAYLPIVAGAERASTLHYCCNDRDFAWGPVPHASIPHDHSLKASPNERRLAPQVLLLDAGCEWNNYASDITRTTPVGNGGKFTPEAREIYSLVLKMQNDAIESLKPGLHWDTVQYHCHLTLVKAFIKMGIFIGTEEEVLDSQVSAAFFPHGVGHSIGLDTHDVPSTSKPQPLNSTIPEQSGKHPNFYTYLRLRLPLATNMVVTVEPGIYFHSHLLAPHRSSKFIDHEVLKRYESVGGVRIEDVLVITAEGAENLTKVGKDVDWLERICGGKDA